MKLFQKASAAVLAVCGVLSAVPGAQAAGLQDLPGQELWQPYLNAAPQDADSFVQDPVGVLLSLLPASPLEMIRQMVHCYADVLLFLLLLVLLSFLVGEAGRQCAFGTGSGCRVRHPFMGRPDDPRAAGVRADDRMERLPSGVPSGLQRGAHRRRRSKCRCSGKRSAADRAMFPCTVHGYSRPSAAAKLSCGQHGVLHQYPERAFRHLPRHRCTAGKKGCAGPAAFLQFYWGCSVQ